MSTIRSNNTLIIFSRSATICRVKTRMWPDLNHRQSLFLHKQNLQHVLNVAHDTHSIRTVIYRTGTLARHVKAKEIKLQTGLDLGEKMHNAIQNELRSAVNVVLIGSDCLEMTPFYIRSAFNSLKSSRDIVLGPANDGGYVLIGMRKSYKPVFTNIPWGSASVMTTTLSRIKSLGLTSHVLEPLIDIDNINDLHVAANRNSLPRWAMPLLHEH